MIEFKTREGGTATVVACAPEGQGAGPQGDFRLMGVCIGKQTGSRMVFCWRLDGRSDQGGENGYDLKDVPVDIEARLFGAAADDRLFSRALERGAGCTSIAAERAAGRREVLVELLGVLMPEIAALNANAEIGVSTICRVERALLLLALQEGVQWPT